MGRCWPPGNARYHAPTPKEIDESLRHFVALKPSSHNRILLDTASGYGRAEERVGQWLKDGANAELASNFVILTKVDAEPLTCFVTILLLHCLIPLEAMGRLLTSYALLFTAACLLACLPALGWLSSLRSLEKYLTWRQEKRKWTCPQPQPLRSSPSALSASEESTFSAVT